MSMKPSAPCCPTCSSAALVKSGHNLCGNQQYLCHTCGSHGVLAPKRQATNPARKALVLQAVTTERLSLRAAERLFGVARQTIAW